MLTAKKVVTDEHGRPVGGASGLLMKAQFKGQPVALKQIRVAQRPRILEVLAADSGADAAVMSEHERQLRREALIFLSIRHQNIAHFIGLSYEEQFFMLTFVLTWADNGSLHDYIHVERQPLTEEQQDRILKEVACAMAYLHASNVVHRDLKSPNVLLDEALCAKITDFGMSTFKAVDRSIISKAAGTEAWASPQQLLQDGELRANTDVYSFGIVAWEVKLMCKPWDVPPFNGSRPLDRQSVLTVHLPLDAEVKGAHIPDAYAELLRGCFCPSDTRYTFAQLYAACAQIHEATATQQQLDRERQRLLLQGPPDAKWKFSDQLLADVKAVTVVHAQRESVCVASLDLAKQAMVDVAVRLVQEAGGRTGAEASDALVLFGHRVAGVAIVHCKQKASSFYGMQCRNEARYRGSVTSDAHPFKPQYSVDTGTGAPVDAEERAILCRVTGFPVTQDAAVMGTHPYRVLDAAMAGGDPHIRVQRVFHGARDLKTAVSILASDFASLRKTDAGWYGAGLYFTPDLDYALQYTGRFGATGGSGSVPTEVQHMKLQAGKEYRAVLVCDVMYANPMPVLDNSTYHGMPLASGHDSHVAVVDFSSDGIGDATPLNRSQWSSKRTAAEIVVEDPSCVLVRGILILEA